SSSCERMSWISKRGHRGVYKADLSRRQERASAWLVFRGRALAPPPAVAGQAERAEAEQRQAGRLGDGRRLRGEHQEPRHAQPAAGREPALERPGGPVVTQYLVG